MAMMQTFLQMELCFCTFSSSRDCRSTQLEYSDGYLHYQRAADERTCWLVSKNVSLISMG